MLPHPDPKGTNNARSRAPNQALPEPSECQVPSSPQRGKPAARFRVGWVPKHLRELKIDLCFDAPKLVPLRCLIQPEDRRARLNRLADPDMDDVDRTGSGQCDVMVVLGVDYGMAVGIKINLGETQGHKADQGGEE
jgi:hypothetical protein